ncbi:MAG: phenylalanine--tRNA ligase subunit beta [Pontiellaceae bacterium]|jgi:phenylalanyl-tRNA synthetase beta chain|nr:phenylalanine--tRNA ligase subunit beta [Pontiellaceae bacterium]
MKFTLSWLKELVDFDDTVAGLSDKLTFAGLEVEHIEMRGGAFDGVVVGEVKRIEPHPNADKLRLCTVEYGGAETLCVVCGAPNVTVGGKYPFATVGTSLPCGITLKKAKIRGVESLGMLCAKDELGLGEDHSGLLVLDAALRPGTSFAEVMGPPETIFELEITPNRPDCLSVIGIAREVAAIYGKPLKMPFIDLKESTEPVENEVRVDVQDTVKCPRYTAHVLKNVQIGPSPDWMKRRLEACGIRSINNVVDITNYVLLETGHPLHAFDATLITDGNIIVRRAAKGEKFTTLDGVERELTEEMLVIADSVKAVALAGIMGGENSGIKNETSTVLLESATFETSCIRATAKALGLYTDSSYRFQRGVNADSVKWVGRRAAALMGELAGARICKGIVDVYPVPKIKRQITVRRANVCGLIGLDLPVDIMKKIFQSLEISILASDTEKALLEIPTFRDDLEREVDITEEVARMYGVDQIPEKLPIAEVVAGVNSDRIRAITACRKNLVGLGAREIMNYTLVSHPLLDLFGKDDLAAREELPHPISAEQSVLRTSLIPQMVESLGRNKSRQINEAVFFEIGRTFIKTGNGVVQTEKVCLGLMGAAGRGALDKQCAISEEEVFLWLKGLVEKLLAAQKVAGVTFQSLETSGAFEENRAVKVLSGGEPIGVLGLINSAARKEWRLNDPVAAAELDIETLISNVWKRSQVQDIPLYPATERDFAFIVDEAVRHEEILAAVQSAAPAELESVKLFDIFRGKTLEKGKKSAAYSFVYRSPSGTLTDEKVNAFHDEVGKRVCASVSAIIREG